MSKDGFLQLAIVFDVILRFWKVSELIKMLFEEHKILRILLEQILDGIECFGLDLERVVDFEFAEEERAHSTDFHTPDVLEELRE